MIRKVAAFVGLLAIAVGSLVGCPAILQANEYELTRKIFDKSGRQDSDALAVVATGKPVSADPKTAIQSARREVLMNAAQQRTKGSDPREKKEWRLVLT